MAKVANFRPPMYSTLVLLCILYCQNKVFLKEEEKHHKIQMKMFVLRVRLLGP